MMTLARSEAKRFRERLIPIEFARAFNCAATLVAILPGGRRGERGGVEKRERRAPADTEIRIGHLIRAQRKTGARAVVRCSAAQVRGDRRSGLPGNDILQPPIAERMLGPAVGGKAVMFAEGKFVQIQETKLVTHIKGRKPPLPGEVAVLLHHDG